MLIHIYSYVYIVCTYVNVYLLLHKILGMNFIAFNSIGTRSKNEIKKRKK